jgi:hypothetical protein
VTTRAQLRSRGDLTPDAADDVFELAARLQVADRALDPARRPLGEGRALNEHLDVAEHFIDDARTRLARREGAARPMPLRPEAPSRWPLLVVALVVAGLVGLLSTVLVGRNRVKQAHRIARRAERALTAELVQQVDRASAVTAFTGPASGAVDALREDAIAAPDVPEQLVAVGALSREMQRVLQDLPSPTTEDQVRLHTDLAQQVRDSRRRIDTTARAWRDANSDWAITSGQGAGRVAVVLDMAEEPQGALHSLPRP